VQDALIRWALDMEESNVNSHRTYLKTEEAKRAKAATIHRTVISGARLRWISKFADVKRKPETSVTSRVPPWFSGSHGYYAQYAQYGQYTPANVTQLTLPFDKSPGVLGMPIIKAISPIPGASSLPEPGSASHTPQVKSQLRNPDVRPTELGSPSFGAIKSTCNENTSKAPSFFNGHPRIKPTSVTHNTDVAALAVSTSSRVPYYTYPSYYYPTADWLQPVTTGDLTETRETHNFVVHDIIWDEANEESYVPATSQRRTKPSVRGRNFHIPWAEHMSTLFGDHVDWNAVLTLPHKARIIGRSFESCPITGRIALYRDPATNIPFASAEAYNTLCRLLEQEFSWSETMGCYTCREIM